VEVLRSRPTNYFPISRYRLLVRSLLDRGLARPDLLGLGLETTRELHVLAADGAPSTRLCAAGPMTKGEAWEITAVPDLRTQAAALADHLAVISVASRDDRVMPAERASAH
jgi:uncharacterized NAD(P)/FAD-binding protein YdhS